MHSSLNDCWRVIFFNVSSSVERSTHFTSNMLFPQILWISKQIHKPGWPLRIVPLCEIQLLCKQYSEITSVIPNTGKDYRSIFICMYVFRLQGPPLWSTRQSSWLQIQRSGFDSRLYQIFWEVVSMERGPFILVSTIEELLERKSSGSGLENRGIRHADCVASSISKSWH
jgi:hypothetical protein